VGQNSLPLDTQGELVIKETNSNKSKADNIPKIIVPPTYGGSIKYEEKGKKIEGGREKTDGQSSSGQRR